MVPTRSRSSSPRRRSAATWATAPRPTRSSTAAGAEPSCGSATDPDSATRSDGEGVMPDADGAIEARAWVATAHGDPTAVLEPRTISVPAPGPNEVRVASRAFCLNFNDIDIIRGRYATLMLEPPFTPGMEAVGTVESAGPGAEHLLGRRIVGIPVLAHGGYATHVVVDAATALELPD